MKTITVSGWKIGFQKVAFTEILKREFGYSLSAAKEATDRILDNHPLALDIAEADLSRVFSRLVELGATVAIEEGRNGQRETADLVEFTKP